MNYGPSFGHVVRDEVSLDDKSLSRRVMRAREVKLRRPKKGSEPITHG